jgi:hypothetical protein
LLSPDPVLVPKSPLLLQGRSNTRYWVQLPKVLVFSRQMLLGPRLENLLLFAVSVYLLNMGLSHQFSMFVVRLVHPQAEDVASCGERLVNTLHN